MADHMYPYNAMVARLAMALGGPEYAVNVLRDVLLNKLRLRPHGDMTQKEVHYLVRSISRLVYRGFLLSGDAQAAIKDVLFGLQRYNFPRSETLGLALTACLEALALSKAESGALRFYIKSLVLTRPVFALEYFLFHANESRVLIREDWDYLFPNHKDPRNPCLRFGEYLLAHRLYFTEDGALSFERLGAILRYGVADVIPLTQTSVRSPLYGRAKVNENITLDLMVTLLTRMYECSSEEGVEAEKCIELVLRTLTPGISMNQLYARSLTCRFTNAGDARDRINIPIQRLLSSGRLPDLRSSVGKDVATLKGLCRGAVRKQLYHNWALPDGIQALEIPLELKSYLDLKP